MLARLQYFAIVCVFGYSALGYAADSTERTSPVDRSPDCMDRSKSTAGADCTIQNGKPHRPVVKSPPPPPKPEPPPNTSPPASASEIRNK